VPISRTPENRRARGTRWSEGERPDFDVTRAEAELVPETSGVESVARDHERRRLLALEEHPDSRGFVHFAGVGPGSYRLRVSHPELAETSFAPLVVAPGAETELHEVVLRPPVRLTVELEPPRDVRRRPWIVALSRHGDMPGHLDRVAIGGAGREGRWWQDGLDSGRYRLVVADASGARWATRDLDLDGADHDVRIELPFERIEGRVTLGGEVLEGATVWSGGRHGETRISAISDEEGAVYVIVPVREAWPIDVRAEEPPVVARLDAVEVHDHPAQPWRRVEIELPDTALGGVVVKEEGDPVAGATVRVMREEPPVRFFIETSDEEGRFSLEALKSGRWRAQAEWRDGEGRRWLSDGVAASVAADRGEQVRLVLRPPWTFSGQIVGPGGGGVFGAEVTGVPVYPQPGERSTYVDTAVTGFSGEFAIDVPAEATAVRLTALPPGYAAMQWPPFERGSPPRVLAVDGNGGTLRIEGLPVLATARVEELPGIFGLDRWSVGTLVRWARMAGGDPGSGEEGALVVPSMSAGRYIVCPGGTSPAVAAAGGEGCVSGELLPYSELTLTTPSP
jgi:hypothetical protein